MFNKFGLVYSFVIIFFKYIENPWKNTSTNVEGWNPKNRQKTEVKRFYRY